MLNIGCHLSSSKGFEAMGKNALKIGANTFQFFTRNPQGGKAKDINPLDVVSFLKIANENKFCKIIAHAPYTLNPCAAAHQTQEFAEMVLADDLKRMEYVPGNYYNFHPGSHVGQGVEIGIDKIAHLLNRTLKPEQATTVLLETMSGKGTEIGARFQELAQIISRTNLSAHIGVCLDTYHVYSAGYDIVANLEGVLEEFDKVIGLKRLKVIHLNDSMMPFNSRKDRHEKLGKGTIGWQALEKIINHPHLKEIPFVLETPNELEGYQVEIQELKKIHRSNSN